MSRLAIPVTAADHHDGPLDAPVVLVEYGDYQCLYCGEAYPELKAAKAILGDDLCFVFRNFPLTVMHAHALHAAEFAELAAETGQFWQAHDLLYENQVRLSDHDLATYAGLLGIDPSTVSHAFGGKYLDNVRADFSGGVRGGVNGTPSLFINGRRYDGPREAQSLISVLNAVRQA